MTKQEILTDELFNKLIKDDKWVRELHHSVRCTDKNGTFLHWRTVTYPIEYIISEKHKEIAAKVYARVRKRMLDDIKVGELVFISAGCDNESLGDVGNYRIRTTFLNSGRKRYFIELLSGGYIDFSIDKDLQNRIHLHNNKVSNELQKPENNDYARMQNKIRPANLQYIEEQPEYNAKGVNRHVKIDYNWQSILKFINNAYGCNYTSARRLPIGYLDTDDFTCMC